MSKDKESKHSKCSNCEYFIQDTQKMGICLSMKELVNYKFKYKEEKYDLQNNIRPLYPRVHKFAICDNYKHKKSNQDE